MVVSTISGVYSRISTRGLNQSIAGLYAARFLGLLDHAQSDSILDTSSCIEELAFCIDGGFNAQGLRDL